jgi:hypothetical protein
MFTAKTFAVCGAPVFEPQPTVVLSLSQMVRTLRAKNVRLSPIALFHHLMGLPEITYMHMHMQFT